MSPTRPEGRRSRISERLARIKASAPARTSLKDSDAWSRVPSRFSERTCSGFTFRGLFNTRDVFVRCTPDDGARAFAYRLGFGAELEQLYFDSMLKSR